MPRTQATNTFSGGLIMDLNPITTPNSVLTDCLNGTIITYNGNEYSLQNDQGNYVLADCRLPENYIPVGVREYGGILYVVSHNPLTEKTQIGSYPSPQTILAGHEYGEGDDTMKRSITEITSHLDETKKYSELIKNYSELFIFYGAAPSYTKLNPGDEYLITYMNVSCPYEELTYYVIDEKHKLYDVTSYVKEDMTTTNYHKIRWDVPGWLAIRPRLADIRGYEVNVRKAKSAGYTIASHGDSIHIELDLRVTVDDPLFTSRIYLPDTDNQGDPIEKLPFSVKYKITGLQTPDTSYHTIKLDKYNDNGNGTVTFYTTLSIPSNSGSVMLESNQIEIESFPILTTTGVEYDKHINTTKFNTTSIGNIDNFKLGEKKWFYYLDSKNKKVTITFDTSGLSEAAVLNDNVYLFYTLYHINGTDDYQPVYHPTEEANIPKPYSNVLIGEWAIKGETTINIDTLPFTQENINYYGNNIDEEECTYYMLYPEDIYFMDLCIYGVESPTASTNPYLRVRKPIILSELMNKVTGVNKLDTVSFNEWFDHYYDCVKNLDINVTNDHVYNRNSNPSISYSEDTKKWLNPKSNLNYPTVVSDDYEINDLSATIQCTIPVKGDVNSPIEVPFGPLWINLNNTSSVDIKYNEIRQGLQKLQLSLSSLTGKTSAEEYSNDYLIKITDNYSFNKTSVGKIWAYSYHRPDVYDSVLETDSLMLEGWGAKGSSLVGTSAFIYYDTNYYDEESGWYNSRPNFPNVWKDSPRFQDLFSSSKGRSYDICRIFTDVRSLDNYTETHLITGDDTILYHKWFIPLKFGDGYILVRLQDSTAELLNKVGNCFLHIISDNKTSINGSFYNITSREYGEDDPSKIILELVFNGELNLGTPMIFGEYVINKTGDLLNLIDVCGLTDVYFNKSNFTISGDCTLNKLELNSYTNSFSVSYIMNHLSVITKESLAQLLISMRTTLTNIYQSSEGTRGEIGLHNDQVVVETTRCQSDEVYTFNENFRGVIKNPDVSVADNVVPQFIYDNLNNPNASCNNILKLRVKAYDRESHTEESFIDKLYFSLGNYYNDDIVGG